MEGNMILVFGGTGQVGRGVVAGLSEKGEDVRIFARDPDITQQAPVLPPRPALVLLRQP